MLLIVKGNVKDAIEAIHANGGTVVDHKYNVQSNNTHVDADISLDNCYQWAWEGDLVWFNDKPTVKFRITECPSDHLEELEE